MLIYILWDRSGRTPRLSGVCSELSDAIENAKAIVSQAKGGLILILSESCTSPTSGPKREASVYWDSDKGMPVAY